MQKNLSKLYSKLFAPVDIASIALFRVAFGALMLWEVYRYLVTGWIDVQFIKPSFHFTYFGFDWVSPWPGIGMYLHFCIMGLLAFCIMAGFFYRIAMVLFFWAFTYVFLLEKSYYLNHFYFLSLVSFIMCFIPANRAFSIDSYRNPVMHSAVIPAWTLWLLRIQIGIPYFFGGIAKINPDWLRGEPLRMWFAYKTHYPVLGPYMTEEWLIYFFSYAGLLFDLLIVPMLLWKKTRPFAYLCAVMFNLTNAWLFNIGVFPWMMIAATTIYFDPDWPRQLFGNWKFLTKRSENKFWRGPAEKRFWGGPAEKLFWSEPSQKPFWGEPSEKSFRKGLILTFWGCYLVVQFLMPLRHFLYPGIVHWTEEGHLFSWHMKLRSKNGYSVFYVKNPESSKTIIVKPFDYLTKRQVARMNTQPDMILQFAHHLAKIYKEKEGADVEVYADVIVSLNGRAPQRLIAEKVDLTKVKHSLSPADWILPMVQDQPLGVEKR